MKTKVFLIALFVLNIFQISAQNNDEVTLVVSADGTTKEEAKKTALRSAIEQAYGTFVSANTTILNDDLVKDEIVTISSGNIKKYDEIACVTLPNGNQSVTLNATVCISKLVSYAQKKGATTEFAGAAFAMDIKMKELNKQNELIAIKHMEEKLNSISNLFDFTLELQTPKAENKYRNREKGTISDVYIVKGKVDVFYNDNTLLYNTILINTLEALALSEEEQKDYEEKGIRTYSFTTPYQEWTETSVSGRFHVSPWRITLRNKIKNEYDLLSKIIDACDISDNISSPTKLDTKLSTHPSLIKLRASYYWQIKNKFLSDKKNRKLIKYSKSGDKICSFDIEIIIPQEDIGKYSKFTISSK